MAKKPNKKTLEKQVKALREKLMAKYSECEKTLEDMHSELQALQEELASKSD